MSVLRQTNLTLVVAHASGHDPIRATELLLTHLGWIARQTNDSEPQVWVLTANNRPGRDPWEFIERIAAHQSRTADEIWRDFKLTPEELSQNPLTL